MNDNDDPKRPLTLNPEWQRNQASCEHPWKSIAVIELPQEKVGFQCANCGRMMKHGGYILKVALA